MRPFKDFVRNRAALVGLRTQGLLAERVGVHRETLAGYVNVNEPASYGEGQLGTQDSIAIALNFSGWSDLLRAWKADDVRSGIGPTWSDAKTVREIASEQAARLEADFITILDADPAKLRAMLVQVKHTGSLERLAKVAQEVLAEREGKGGKSERGQGD